MEIKANLCNNAVRKIGLLIIKASDIGMDLSGYGFADENQNSGNVYLWLEDYQFTLYIGLGSDTIYASWSNPINGEEEEIEVGDMTIRELETWASDLNQEAEEEA